MLIKVLNEQTIMQNKLDLLRELNIKVEAKLEKVNIFRVYSYGKLNFPINIRSQNIKNHLTVFSKFDIGGDRYAL